MKNQRLRTIATGFLAVSVLSVAGMTQAQTVNSVLQQSEENTKALAAAQVRINGITEQTDGLVQEYRVVNKQIEGLKIYNAQTELQIADQEAKLVKIEESIAKAATLDRDVSPLMVSMIDALDQLIDLDLPFLVEERKERVAKLRRNLGNSDLSSAERFRQVLEAYNIELDYGNNVSATTETVNVDGTDVDVNVLRIGRIALMYQTKDQSTTKAWNAEAGDWEPISQGDYASAVSEGLRIANKQSPINIMTIPAPAPQEATQ